MLGWVVPHLRVDSVLDLTVEELSRFRLRGLLLDVDCTLKDHGAAEFRPEIAAWIDNLRTAEMRMCLLSNGRPRRIERLASSLGVPFVAQAMKPWPSGCHVAVQRCGLPSHEVAVVGDQLFADVLAGRLAGLFTILVNPTSKVEPWFTKLKRPLERPVLSWLDRRDRRRAARQTKSSENQTS
ncbi:MAG: YqeG family HAD IIIA-type phosphatase [Pirellulales bacterium]|nr:YqeG family HAD IIIA-type phosphatase [Pirellulales bacterium]